ncbi:MAG: Pyruvate flavodoxin/ferredoxin oxidoreductase domain protein [Microgenomates group bacterium GW2011_GWB1_44_8]|nr:MAG: Pyruvate flavodoxin/ferredoxin oxidoreductase domain protein [Microgenomates group bacterium GW2011_GWB1_44_8]
MVLPYFTFKIGGQAGQGVKSAGLMFARLATRSGYWVHNHTEYPSVIRGGHNVTSVTVSSRPVYAPTKHTDLLVALNKETVSLHNTELIAGSIIVCDTNIKLDDNLDEQVICVSVPINKITREIGEGELLGNTIALGCATALLNANLEHINNLIDSEFADKSPSARIANRKAAKSGFDYVTVNFPQYIKPVLAQRQNVIPLSVLNADDTVALGAISAGMQFASIYPMTPISNILHTLAPVQKDFGFIYKQPEDEISGINMAIGASFAGARSMVATSGGGFCLMTEGYSLAGITETPLVIVEGMRGGPSTGMPTWNEQADLRFILHAGQGDFPRIVLAAGDPEEAFHLTLKAFNLADKYQTPVILILDKNICEDDQSYGAFEFSRYQVNRGLLTTNKEDDYSRYKPSGDGISARTIPGCGNYFIANSVEHNAVGYSSEEANNRCEQMNKRMKKLQTYSEEDLPPPILYGPEEAEVTIVSWGSNKGAILEALNCCLKVNFLHLTRINPFPAKEVSDILKKSKHILNIECNYTAQMAGLIREQTGIEINDRLLCYDGRPIYPEDIIDKLTNITDAVIK